MKLNKADIEKQIDTLKKEIEGIEELGKQYNKKRTNIETKLRDLGAEFQAKKIRMETLLELIQEDPKPVVAKPVVKQSTATPIT